MKTIFIFIDGLGIGSDDPAINPLRDPRFPNLGKLLATAIPLDACLGVDGLPQSATGQATLLTGANAAQAMGRHVEGFPPPRLKKLIERENLFSKLCKLGKRCTFANGYLNIDPNQIPLHRHSATTVMTLAALGRVRGNAELAASMALTHDITRRTMHERGYDGPPITPETAADHLLAIGEEHDFTLFEYFLTDRAGHARDPDQTGQCLETLERFLPRVASFAGQSNRLFLLCSDHGNIEDRTTFSHTKNPVPLVALGDRAAAFQNLDSLADVTPAIVRLYEPGAGRYIAAMNQQPTTRPGWDEYFMDIAHVVSKRGNCCRRKVAAVIVRDRRIISTGYNGTPRGIDNCCDGGCPRCASDAPSGSSLGECICAHAEENAIVQAAYHGIAVKDSTLYCNLSPCLMCTKMIINAGIKEVVYETEYHFTEQARNLLATAGVLCRQFER